MPSEQVEELGYASLSPLRRSFVDEYLVDLNATQAAIRAGYSARTARSQAARLLANVNIREAIQQRMDERAARCEVTQDRVVEELAKIAFVNLGSFFAVNEQGLPYVDLSKADKAAWSGLQEITVDEYADGSGDDVRLVKKVKLKLGDKMGALTALGRHLSLFVDRQEVSGPGGNPVELAHRAAEGALEKLRAMVDKRRAQAVVEPSTNEPAQ